MELSTTVLGVVPAGRRRRGRSLLLVSVGADDDNLEFVAGLALVDSSVLVHARSEDAALVLGNRRRVLARALIRVPGRVTLDVDVETFAQLGVVAVLGAPGDVVAFEDLVSEVGVGVDGSVEVLEGLLVARGGLSVLSHLVVDRVRLERLGCIGDSRRAICGGLGSARVQRVDESAVGANFNGSRASRVAGESPGVGPAHRSARGRDNVGWCGCRDRSHGVRRRCRGRCARRLRRGRLRAKLGEEEAQGALLDLDIALGVGSSLGGASSSSLGCSDGLSLVVGTSYLGWANADRGTASDSDGDGGNVGSVEVLGSGRRVGSDEGSSPDEGKGTHDQ